MGRRWAKRGGARTMRITRTDENETVAEQKEEVAWKRRNESRMSRRTRSRRLQRRGRREEEGEEEAKEEKQQEQEKEGE